MSKPTPNRNTILMSCRVPFHRNLYVIGTLARRVSFATQQRRAFNLAHAIDLDLKASGDPRGIEEKNVAIIGAGLAGLTAEFAFTALKASAWLYEAESSVLAHLDSISHRYIHPTINFWPIETFEPTTRFPGMNWTLGSCESVIRQIMDDRTALGRKSKVLRTRLRTPHVGHRIERVRRSTVGYELFKRVGLSISDSDLVPIQYTPLTGEQAGSPKSQFDIVIIATGFGRDAETDPSTDGTDDIVTPGYWQADGDLIAQKILSFDGYEKVVISGTGDGGLIELIRLLWGDFVDNDGFANAVNDILINAEHLKKAIARIESEAAKKIFDAQLHLGAINTPHEATEGEVSESVSEAAPAQTADLIKAALEQAEAEIAENYLDAIIPHLIETPLGKCLLDAHEQWVNERWDGNMLPIHMIGLKPDFLEFGAAPIHKVLAAFAHKKGLFQYMQVETEWVRKVQPETNPDDFRGPLSRPLPQYLIVTPAIPGADAVTHEHCLLYQRHGGKPDLDIFKDLENADILSDCITRLQQTYADTDWLDQETFRTYIQQLFDDTDDTADPAEKQALHYTNTAQNFFMTVRGRGISQEKGHYISYKLDPAAAAGSLQKPFLPVDSDPDHFFAIPVQPGRAPSLYDPV